MATRIRNDNFISNQENMAALKGKVAPVQLKNRALAEIGNKVKNQNVVLPNKGKCGIQSPGTKNKNRDEVSQLAQKVQALPSLNSFKDLKPSRYEALKSETEALSFSAKCLDVIDIDKEHYKDQTFIGEYAKDIYTYLKSLEVKHPIRKDFLNRHAHTTPRMRSIVVDWLVELQGQFNLLQETLFLGITIVDRYLQKFPFTEKKKLQLVGATAMFVSSKYEETYPPPVSDFEQICCLQYSKEEFLKMEAKILKSLGFFMGFPLSVHFLRRYAKVTSPEEETYTLAKYCQELCIVEYELCHYRPSLMAAASLFVAQWLLSDQAQPTWSDDLVYYSGYSKDEVLVLAKQILSTLSKVPTSKFQAVTEKYSSKQYFKVACLKELSTSALKKKMIGLNVTN